MNGRLNRLRVRAGALDHEVLVEQARPEADSLRVQELKRRKLATRDEIARLEAGVVGHG